MHELRLPRFDLYKGSDLQLELLYDCFEALQ